MKKISKVLAFLLVVATVCTLMVPIASAATAYPSFSSSKPAEVVAQDKILCYYDSALRTRGTCNPSKAYGAYASRGDVCKILGFVNGGSVCVLSYPTSSSGYKTAYARTSDILPSSTASESFASKARVNTYQYSNGSGSWGYIAVGDTVYLTGAASGGYSQVVYPAGSRYKVAWVRTSEINAARPAVSKGVNPKGFVDRSEALPAPGTFRIVGWALDADTPAESLTIHVYVGGPAGSKGATCYSIPAKSYRPDVKKAYPSLVSTDYTGFDRTFTIQGLEGSVPVYIYAINKGGGKNVLIGSKTIYIQGESSPTTANTALSYALYKSTGGKLTCGFDGYVSTSGRHEGIDFANAIGSAIYSLTDGVVTKVQEGYRGSKGLSTIAVYSESANKTVVYLHSDPENSLKVGQRVSRGQLIAYEDWRGCSQAKSAHTHVEVRNGKRYAAAVSVGDSVLDNPNPSAFWNSYGYQVK